MLKEYLTINKNFAEEPLQWLPAGANIPKDEVLDKEVANHAVLQACPQSDRQVKQTHEKQVIQAEDDILMSSVLCQWQLWDVLE